MKVEVIKAAENMLELKIIGEDHSFLNMLVRTLLKDKHVKFASYSIDHPLIENPILIIETDSEKTPYDALKEAAERIKKLSQEFRAKFKEALGKAE